MSVVYTSISYRGYTGVSPKCKRDINYCKCTNLRRVSYWPKESIPHFEAAAASFVPTNYEQCVTCMYSINKLKETISMLNCTEKKLQTFFMSNHFFQLSLSVA